MRKSKSLYVLLLLMIAVVMCGAAVLGTLSSPNVISEGQSASVEDGIMPASEPLGPDLFMNCTNYTTGVSPTIYENPWHGRIEVKLNLGGSHYIYVNIDPREMGLVINDDTLVEFRSYYVDGNREINYQLDRFHAYIFFTAKSGKTQEASCTATSASTGGWTRSSTFKDTVRIDIWLTVETHYNFTRTAKFEFYN